MKVETRIAIEADLLEQVEVAAKSFHSCSEVFERALREYLPKLKPQKRKLTREEEIAQYGRQNFCGGYEKGRKGNESATSFVD